MERLSRRLDLPAFPRSRSSPRHPGQLALSRLRRMGRLQLLVLLLQIGSLGLLIRMALVEPRPFCRLQQWSSSPRSGTWPSTHLN
jgi:hypothetical protein